MSFYPEFSNYLGFRINPGESIDAAIKLTSRSGDPVRLSYTNPDIPDEVISLVIQAMFVGRSRGDSHAFFPGAGLTVIDSQNGIVELAVPAGRLNDEEGYRWVMSGYYSNTGSTTSKVYVQGTVSVQDGFNRQVGLGA